MIRIGTVELKLWCNTASSWAFLKWPPRKKCRNAKKRNLISQLLIIRNIHNLPLDIYLCFEDEKYDDNIYKFFTYRTTQNPRWPPVFAKKSFSVWNQLICHSEYCLSRSKTMGFKVLCGFIANQCVNSDKSGKHGLPEAFFKMSALENGKKPKSNISVVQLLLSYIYNIRLWIYVFFKIGNLKNIITNYLHFDKSLEI